MILTIQITPNELIDKGYWDNYCKLKGISEWAVNEGLMDSSEVITLSIEEAKDIGLLSEDYTQ